MTITLYKTDIIPQKNMLVDDIISYLNNIPLNSKYVVAYDAQYFPLKSEYEYVVNLYQSDLFYGEYNYLTVDKGGNEVYMYFIKSYEWSGSRSVKLYLVLDTVNTFLHDKDLSTVLDSKTSIIRQHEDRILVKEPEAEGGYIRKIDLVDEGIHPIKYVKNKTKVGDKSIPGINNWYLIYRNNANITPENQSQPIECFCVADIPLLINKGISNLPEVKYTKNELIEGYSYYLDPVNNKNAKLYFGAGSSPSTAYEVKENEIYRIILNGNNIEITKMIYNKNKFGVYVLDRVEDKGSLLNEVNFINCKNLRIANYYTTSWNEITRELSTIYVGAGTIEDLTVQSISEINKNDPFLIKIIKLPYAPDSFFFGIDGTFQYVRSRWEVSRGMLKLKDLSTEFSNTIDDFNITDKINISIPQITGEEERSIIYESKLYNSNFYSLKLVYDSFNYEFLLELFNFDRALFYPDYIYNITFKPTNTINSNLLFSIANIDFKTPFDFPNLLISNRNNEITIYNSEYIRYINYGYNRDKERMNRQNTMNWVNTGLSLGASILGMGIGINSGKLAGGLLASTGYSGLQSAINSIGTNIVSQINNEQLLAQKLDDAKLAGTTISGNNDNDLMSFYSDNKLWIIESECDDIIKESAYKLFYYCGYARGYQGIPKFNTRIYFNYVQCNPVFTNEVIGKIKNNYLNDIASRFQSGVTVYHKYKGKYDFEQLKENWEVKLL